MILERRAFIGGVMALGSHEDIVFAGSGNDLLVYWLPTCTLIEKISAFPHGRVHGVFVQQDGASVRVIAFGQRQLVAYSLDVENVSGSAGAPAVSFTPILRFSSLPSFVHSVAFVSDKLYVGLSSNVVHLYSIPASGPLCCDPRPETVYGCDQKTLISSMDIFVAEDGQVNVAAGTMFGKAYVWCISDTGSPCKILDSSGAIVRIRWYERGTMLVAASEDRTIRTWHYRDAVWVEARVLHGHKGWIWDFVLVHSKYMISVGEDAMCRVWDLETGNSLTSFHAHAGRHIWRIAVVGDMLLTGGEDSAVRLWQVASVLGVDASERMYSLRPVLCNSPKGVNCNEFIRDIAYLQHWLFVSTSAGRVLGIDLLDHGKVTVAYKCGFQVSCMAGIGNGILLMGGLCGKISLLQSVDGSLQHVCTIQAHSARVLDMFWPEGAPIIFSSCEGCEGQLKCWHVSSNWIISPVTELVGPTSRRIGSVAMIPFPEKALCLVLCGDRRGSLSVFVMCSVWNQQSIYPQIDAIHPAFRVADAHGGSSVTSIVVSSQTTGCHLLSARVVSGGYDGSVCEYNLTCTSDDEEQNHCTVSVVKMSSIPFRQHLNIVQTLYVEGSEGLYASGFTGKRFEIWQLKDKVCRVASIVCGGSKRAYTAHFVSASSSFIFAYLNGMEVTMISRGDVSTDGMFTNLKPYSSLRPSFHGREIHAVAFLPCLAPDVLVATASEDGTVIISNVAADVILPLNVLYGHNGSVRALAVLVKHSDTYLFSGGALEELLVWKINSCPPYESSLLCKHSGSSGDVEQRYMALQVMLLCNKVYLAAAQSDSDITIFEVDVQGKKVIPICSLTFHESAVLSLASVCVDGGNQILLISGSSDGTIACWKLSPDEMLPEFHPAPFETWTAHSAGVNCLTPLCGKEIFVLSGGDDQDICVHILGLQPPIQAVIKNAHASAIKGIAVYGDRRIVLTLGCDQRLIGWRLEESLEMGHSLKWEGSVVVNVMDVACMSVNQGIIGVGGVGLEMFTE